VAFALQVVGNLKVVRTPTTLRVRLISYRIPAPLPHTHTHFIWR